MSSTPLTPADPGATADAVNLGMLAGIRGEVARYLQKIDWTKHPLGPPSTWPHSLCTTLRVMLASRFPMWLGWSENLFFFYNDAYAPTLGLKEPTAFGKAFKELWPEVLPDLQPRFDDVLQNGQATWDEGLMLLLERSGYIEETYHTFSYSPVPSDDAKIGGLFCAVSEVTDKIIGERRMDFLRDLATQLNTVKTEPEVLDVVERLTLERAKDLPFALLYLFENNGESARLARAVGVEAGCAIAPSILARGSNVEAWPAQALYLSHALAVVTDLNDHFSDVPRGPWTIPPREAALVPIANQGQTAPAGFLVVGINPYRPFGAAYRGFLELFAGQIAAGLSSARAYEAERKRAEALAEVDRAKTIFFSNVSHELRTPLTLMLGPIEEIAARDGDRESQKLAVVAQRNGQRLLKLVNSLLDFSRIEAGRMRATFVPTDLVEFTTELASTFRSAIEAAGLTFVIDAAPLSAPVYVDRNLWEKIIFNLLSNAFKFTLKGEIRVELRQTETSAQVAIKDTGVGIPASAKARLFERFFRVEGTAGRTHEGTGIGLALVQELVKLHGGEIAVNSELNHGSVFTLSLPLGSKHLPKDQVREDGILQRSSAEERIFFLENVRSISQSDDGADRSGGKRPDLAEPGRKEGKVLLVDDNADMREYAARLLKQRFDVVAVADGQAALEVLETEKPDLILSDVMMPRLDGFGLIRAVRKHPVWRTLPVILLSARAGEEARMEGIGGGATDYLVKPFSAEELLARVTAHLGLVQARREAEAQVRESEERIRLAVDAGEVGTWSWDLATQRVEWSARTSRIFGRGETESVGDLYEFLNYVHPAERTRIEENLRRAAESMVAYFGETRIVRPDGTTRWVSLQGKVFSANNGSAPRLLGALIDVTENKLREQTLRDTRARLDATLEAAAIGTWTWDISRNLLLGDVGLFRLFSLADTSAGHVPLEELLGKIHPDDLPRVQDSLLAATQGQAEAFEEDYRVVQPDGSFIWVASRGKMRRDEDRDSPMMSGVLIDITSRKQAETDRTRLLQQEQEAREEAEVLSQTAQALTADLDLKTTVQSATDAATQLTNAAFGAFFYNLVNEHQESYVLFTLSGLPRESFEKFGLPRNTAVFGPTFKAEGVVRLDNVQTDPRYGKNAPFQGMPPGHPPVRSYLAVPVVSRTGEVLGGMFFGHPTAGVFTPRSERIALGIAAQASIAIDNAKLYQRAQSSIEQLNFSLSSLQLGLWNWNRDTDAISFSSRTAEIFGLASDSPITREQMRATIHPNDRGKARQSADVASESAADYDIEYRVVHPTRGLRWVVAKGRPVFNSERRMTGMMGVVQDITERKQAELQLSSQRDVLEQVVTGVPLAEILERLTTWVEQFAERKVIATISLVEEDGCHLRFAAGKNCPADWIHAMERVEIGPDGEPCGAAAFRHESVVVSDIATDPLWAATRVRALAVGLRACWSSPIMSSAGTTLGAIAVYYVEPSTPSRYEIEIVEVVTRTAAIAIERKNSEHDLTESRRRLEEHAQLLEKTVTERTAKLRETIGELEAFSYSVSHDMRAPLRAMQGYAHLILKEHTESLKPEAMNYLKRISMNAERLELLVRDVLTYSKVAKEDIELRPVDLNTFVPSLLSQIADLQRSTVTISIEEPLPIVLAHEAYLSQIFTNLLGNAVKFSSADRSTAITIKAEREQNFFKLSVCDNGIGIDPAHFSRIFEIFGRVYPDKKFEGTGIGLSIVKKAIQRMGGTVGVDSTLGIGSCFWFTLRSP